LKAKKNVLLPQPIESEAVALLEKKGCHVIVAPEPKPDVVGSFLKGVQGLILRTGITITRELLAYADDLQVISRTGGGLDNVDVAAASEKGILVTSNLGVNTSSVVEHVLALMMSLAKQLPLMDNSVRSQRFSIRYQNLPRDLREKTLGLLGFGRIGSEVGRVCRNIFRMRILVFDPFLPENLQATYRDWVEFTDLQTLFSSADVISIHVPLTDQTQHLVGRRELGWMKPDGLLINAARGPVIDEEALVEALRNRKIGGAGLDVFTREPLPAEHPLLKLDNVILTPHTAALTLECVIRMAVEAAQCVIDVLEGNIPPNLANPQLLNTERFKHLVPKRHAG
jgi:D-3-phosphoglycerate dehydrogenase / 2-oxoglutarate reductase